MPTISGATGDGLAWLQSNWLWLAVVALGLFLIWRFARPLIGRVVLEVLRAQNRAIDGVTAPEDEVRKRADTIDQLVGSLVRIGVGLAIVVIVLGLLDLWPVIAGLGLIAAAITLAGQSIVLDYLMGLVILLEGHYYKGDVIRTGGLDGVVEVVGLRRTVLRDVSGTVHSVSNGEIRSVSNMTRVYATAIVEIPGVRESDIEAVIDVMNRVGADLAADPAWSARILEAPGYTSTIAFTDLGVTLRMAGRVQAADRWAVPAELRRRIGPALGAAGIELNRRLLPGEPSA